jgi:hypothetical protein
MLQPTVDHAPVHEREGQAARQQTVDLRERVHRMHADIGAGSTVRTDAIDHRAEQLARHRPCRCGCQGGR